MDLKRFIYRRVKHRFPNIPSTNLNKISGLMSTAIERRENEGEILSLIDLDVLVPFYIKANIRHSQTGYDHNLNNGKNRTYERKRLRQFISDMYKFWTRGERKK